jgi:8-oxo-dGTP pyrophosphatase MutT (NUDIX family)
MILRIDQIKNRLRDHEPAVVDVSEDIRSAAVAIVLREVAGDPEVLFIRRAEVDGDPWSGHMAFPGGHSEPADTGLHHTAMRETHEETGIDLDVHGSLITALDPHYAMSRANMVIAPYVFELTGDTTITPNHEVAEVIWSRVQPLISGEVYAVKEWHHAGMPRRMAGYEVDGGHIVWGLTYRILGSLFRILHPDWEPPADPPQRVGSS